MGAWLSMDSIVNAKERQATHGGKANQGNVRQSVCKRRRRTVQFFLSRATESSDGGKGGMRSVWSRVWNVAKKASRQKQNKTKKQTQGTMHKALSPFSFWETGGHVFICFASSQMRDVTRRADVCMLACWTTNTLRAGKVNFCAVYIMI